jgi:endonuclease/exonuclease/phosphatase family metal-dependent hydrolase
VSHPTQLALAVLAAGSFAAAGGPAAADVLVEGKSLSLRASAAKSEQRALSFKSRRSPAIAAPFPEPAQGASLLLFNSNAAGHCRAEIELPAERWEALGGSGAQDGWRYRDDSGEAGGITRVTVEPGRLGGRVSVRGKGASLPCGLEAQAQATPFELSLRIGLERWCASFGGRVTRNERGRFRARGAPAPDACPDGDISVATLNILHGAFCRPETAGCRRDERVALVGQWIVARGCPDAVALQEIAMPLEAGIEQALSNICPFPYHATYLGTNFFDDTLLLTRRPVLEAENVPLHPGFRVALFVRLDHPTGRAELISTHLASSSDGATDPCEGTAACPAECVAAGAATVRDCQAVQVADLAMLRHDPAAPAFVAGDFNEVPGSFVYLQLVERGFVDTTLAAGGLECDPPSGVGCTSGRADEDLSDLESLDLGVLERIDYLFWLPAAAGQACSGTLDSAEDADDDGVATRLFADEPNPFAADCGSAPLPICWPSDHNGVQADLNCEPAP